MRRMAAIAGIGETVPTRASDRDLRTLVVDAIAEACADAGIMPEMIDGVVTDTMMMPTTVPPDWVAAQFGFDCRLAAGVSCAGAGNAYAPRFAAGMIANGEAETVLIYFGTDWGSRAGGAYAFHDAFPAKVAFEKPHGFSAQAMYFALWARRYKHLYGKLDAGLEAIALAARHNAVLNGGAQNRRPLDSAAYRASRVVADPLRVADCCLLSDGACAMIVTSLERARDLRSRPVRVLGGALRSCPVAADNIFTQLDELDAIPAAHAAAQAALGEAGIGLGDVDFAEVYDCFSISCLLQIEDLGFCGKGEAQDFILENGITTTGRLPVNTHGGLLAHSYLLGAEHVVEAVRQLRGDAGGGQVADAGIGLVSGLSMPEHGVLLLARD